MHVDTVISSADRSSLQQAAALLREGRLVSFPTETVYGLGADATSASAVTGIYAAKSRPRFNPLISHVPTCEAAFAEGVFDSRARRLAEAFWPGPLTLVVPAGPRCQVCDLARAGLDSVALRVPNHTVARALLAEVGRPIAAPSANRSGRISPTDARAVAEELDGRVALVLDAGPTSVGLESTIVACLESQVRLLRPGGLSRSDIEQVLGESVAGRPDTLLAPGMMASHYAPASGLRLNASDAESGEAMLDFAGQLKPLDRGAYLDLSPEGRLDVAAVNLFAYLRRLDQLGLDRIAVAPVPGDGLGEAINDRLARAAAPR